ncbi:hypothetical protein TSUD_175940 [Trifolium subterraneum]|uniref:Albumin I chain a domain-containing protein n=1 Tax=Trifolium subterraneum TaxID=3900 RepID=A0A2Z6LKE3_TRISU|nr:hypothetical protein TSUD_175940 [Trifolium subterraneum]
MAYVKLVLSSVFFLATFVMFSMNKVDALCLGRCTLTIPCSKDCFCTATAIYPVSFCIPISYKDAVKIIGENLICQDDTECKNKGTKNFCIRSPKPDVEYGLCADSTYEAENLIFKIFSKSKFTKDFLEMAT